MANRIMTNECDEPLYQNLFIDQTPIISPVTSTGTEGRPIGGRVTPSALHYRVTCVDDVSSLVVGPVGGSQKATKAGSPTGTTYKNYIPT